MARIGMCTYTDMSYSIFHTQNIRLKTLKNISQSTHPNSRTRGPQLWNSLENSLMTSKSVKHFRNQFKQKIISSYK